MAIPESLKEFYEHLDKVQEAMLSEAKQKRIYKNPLTKGGLREGIILRQLETRLPSCLGLGKGEIIDSQGGRSSEFDIVLSNRLYCPVACNTDNTNIYFVESVAAVLEVKSKLDKKELLDAKKKFMSLEALERMYIEKPTFSVFFKGATSAIRHFLQIYSAIGSQIPSLPEIPDYQKSLSSKACESNSFTASIKRIIFAFDSISETKLLGYLNASGIQADFVCVLTVGCYWKGNEGQWVRYSRYRNHFGQFLFCFSSLINTYFHRQYSCFDFDIGKYF